MGAPERPLCCVLESRIRKIPIRTVRSSFLAGIRDLSLYPVDPVSYTHLVEDDEQDYTNVDSNGYGWLLLASEAIEYDTYQNFLEWVDWHSGFNWSNYGEWDGTKYTILLDPSVYNSISTQ